jgi:hypothetical protein
MENNTRAENIQPPAANAERLHDLDACYVALWALIEAFRLLVRERTPPTSRKERATNELIYDCLERAKTALGKFAS